jgi:hypothetical protein
MNPDKPAETRDSPDNEVIFMGGEIIIAQEDDNGPFKLTEEMKKRMREKFPRPNYPPDAPPEAK